MAPGISWEADPSTTESTIPPQGGIFVLAHAAGLSWTCTTPCRRCLKQPRRLRRYRRALRSDASRRGTVHLDPAGAIGLAMWKYVLGWIPMVFIAIANGAIREGWYGKYVSELQAHQLSTATGVLLFGVYIWVLVRIWRPASTGQALTLGLVWLGMT